MALPIQRVLPLVGKIDSLIYSIPVLGETALRAKSRALGRLAFRVPLLGAKPAQHVGHVQDQFLRFLGLLGLKSTVIDKGDGYFVMQVDQCPYGFAEADEAGVCDACMDLDRAYVGEMGARLEIEERIPGSAHHCTFRISFP